MKIKTQYWEETDINEFKRKSEKIFWYLAIFAIANTTYAFFNESYILLGNVLPAIAGVLAITSYNKWRKQK